MSSMGVDWLAVYREKKNLPEPILLAENSLSSAFCEET